MSNLIGLVTGANAGIGKATALELAKSGATVVMVCRDAQKGKQSQQEIIAQSGNQSIALLIADFSSQQSIHRLVAEFKQKYPKLDILINNAAVHKAERTTTADGLETMFATNHLGYFLLTNLLLDSLRGQTMPASSTSRLRRPITLTLTICKARSNSIR